MDSPFKNRGVGVGLRRKHFDTFINHKPQSVSWVEVISENYMAWENRPICDSHRLLLKIREDYPVFMHGVSLSLGSADPLNFNYLKRLKELVDLVNPEVVSDHVCWTGVDGINAHDLLPLPYTSESLTVMKDKILQVQDFLQRRILIENPSSYVDYSVSEMAEFDFIKELSQRTDCGILLDINNVYVSSVNHNFDPKEYLKNIPFSRVGQIHLAGHSEQGGFLVDTHDAPVGEEVWALYQWFTKSFGTQSTMIERDGKIPSWSELEQELLKIGEIQNEFKSQVA